MAAQGLRNTQCSHSSIQQTSLSLQGTGNTSKNKTDMAPAQGWRPSLASFSSSLPKLSFTHTHAHAYTHRLTYIHVHICIYTAAPIFSSSTLEQTSIPLPSPSSPRLLLLYHPWANPTEIFVTQTHLSPPQEACMWSPTSCAHSPHLPHLILPPVQRPLFPLRLWVPGSWHSPHPDELGSLCK